jgi:hypothetical protein
MKKRNGKEGSKYESTIYHFREYFPFWIASWNWRGVSTSITFFLLPDSTTYHISFLCFQIAFSIVPLGVDNRIILNGLVLSFTYISLICRFIHMINNMVNFAYNSMIWHGIGWWLLEERNCYQPANSSSADSCYCTNSIVWSTLLIMVLVRGSIRYNGQRRAAGGQMGLRPTSPHYPASFCCA